MTRPPAETNFTLLHDGKLRPLPTPPKDEAR